MCFSSCLTYHGNLTSKESRRRLSLGEVTTTIHNLILGKMYYDHHGNMDIHGNCQYSCRLKFKEKTILRRNPHQ
ncbi:hypothetical protein RJT34_07823 [Clitoria ternatea]|uniref:Uncharacterized protein n=1 Tax=Clitoria ternatea TaxID=43366 RepID=A0AAN9K6Z3_CLITE